MSLTAISLETLRGWLDEGKPVTVELLRARGFQAVRLDEGILNWRARGLPVAIGEGPIKGTFCCALSLPKKGHNLLSWADGEWLAAI
jgi:hypothetical protein